MNPVEIEEEIVKRLKYIKNQSELEDLKTWAKKAKKQVVIEPSLYCFGKVNYTYNRRIRSQGSGRSLGLRTEFVDYIYFIYLGVKVTFDENYDHKKYVISESEFKSKRIWDNQLKEYNETQFYPNENITDYFGFNIKDKFFEYLKDKNYHLVDNGKKIYLSCREEISNKILRGYRVRLTKFDQYFCHPIDRKYLNMFVEKEFEVKMKDSVDIDNTNNINWR